MKVLTVVYPEILRLQDNKISRCLEKVQYKIHKPRLDG